MGGDGAALAAAVAVAAAAAAAASAADIEIDGGDIGRGCETAADATPAIRRRSLACLRPSTGSGAPGSQSKRGTARCHRQTGRQRPNGRSATEPWCAPTADAATRAKRLNDGDGRSRSTAGRHGNAE